MTDFHVGQKVVCVDDVPAYQTAIEPTFPIKRGELYTIRWVGAFDHPFEGEHLCCRVSGIERLYLGLDIPFAIRRFRPLVSQAASIFRAIAQGVSDGKPIIEDAEYRQGKPQKVKA